MKLTPLTVPAYPHQEVFERRLALGLHGSPTLLIDGVDPFAARCAADG